MVGGGIQSFLPTKNGKVVCGCFSPDLHPDAPEEVVVAVGPQREQTAVTAVLQLTSFPIFLKRDSGLWECMGDYRGTRYLQRGHKLLEAEARVKSEKVAGILYMARVDPALAEEPISGKSMSRAH